MENKKTFLFPYVAVLILLLAFPFMGKVFAQANRTNSGDITCPAVAGGASLEVLPVRSSRYSMVFNNVSGVAIRLGYLNSGTALLDTTNSWLLQPGQTTGDSVPGVLNKRVVCMSTIGAALISFNETYR